MARRLALFLILWVGIADHPEAAEPAVYEAYAVRYGSLKGYPVAQLVQGAEAGLQLDIAMMVWVLKGPGRTILVDSGFYRPRYLEENPGLADYVRPDEAVARLGIKPGDVTDIIITHTHWDHLDGADLFPRATTWIQRAEYEHYTARPRPAEHLAALVRLHEAGRVRLVDGDAREILPGVKVYTGGKHTFESEYVGVITRAGTMVIASDNLYLYENLDKHVPIAATLDAAANLAAQDRMKQIASNPRLIIPGHDPEVFARFGKVAAGVVRLD